MRQPEGARLEEGQPLNLVVRAEGTEPMQYQWHRGGQPLQVPVGCKARPGWPARTCLWRSSIAAGCGDEAWRARRRNADSLWKLES